MFKDAMLKLKHELDYYLLEKKLKKLGFNRRFADTDGSDISKVASGIVLLSKETDKEGNHMMVLFTHVGWYTSYRVTGFNEEKNGIVDIDAGTEGNGFRGFLSVNQIRDDVAQRKQVFLQQKTKEEHDAKFQ